MDNIVLPDSFDGRVVWDGLLKTSPFTREVWKLLCFLSSTSMLAVLFNIQSVGIFNINLSPAKLIICDLQGNELEKNNWTIILINFQLKKVLFW